MRVIGSRGALLLGAILVLPLLVPPAYAAPGDPVVPTTPAVTPGSGPVSVSVVVPVTAPPGESGLLDAETLEVSTAPTGALTRQLDEILTIPSITIGLDPMIPASIRALGSSAPGSAIEWLGRLEAAPNEVFLLAYADADLGVVAEAGALGEAVPLGFGFALDPADFDGPPPDPEPTPGESTPPAEDAGEEEPPDDGESSLPTTEELLAWPDALPGVAWPAEGALTAAAIEALGGAGYSGVILDEGNVSGSETARAQLGAVDALVSDSELSGLLRTAARTVADAEREAAIAALVAALDTMASSAPGRTVIATLDRHWPLGVYRLSGAVSAIESAASAQLVPLSSVSGGPAATATLVEPPEDSELVGRVQALFAADRAERDFADILDDPLLLTAPRRLELLRMLSATPAAGSDWEDDTVAFLERSREILHSVEVVEGSTLQVISSSTNLRIAVSNALEFPVTVVVRARPLRPLLQVDGPVTITIEPDSSKTAVVPAQAVTNGQVSIEVTLLSPNRFVEIGTSRLLRANLQAQWETVGLVVGILVVLVFAGGIVRNIVRRRRAARTESPDSPAADPVDG